MMDSKEDGEVGAKARAGSSDKLDRRATFFLVGMFVFMAVFLTLFYAASSREVRARVPVGEQELASLPACEREELRAFIRERHAPITPKVVQGAQRSCAGRLGVAGEEAAIERQSRSLAIGSK